MKRNNIVIGVIFVVLGLLFLINNTGLIRIDIDFFDIGFLFAKFWPAMFLIIPGLAMHSIFFSGKNKDAGILVPGGILLFTGLTCQVSMLFNVWGITWPGFILAVAIGLFELYLFGSRNKGLLIPVGILTVLSVIFFDAFTFRWLHIFDLKEILIGAFLIILGASIIFKNRRNKNEF
ncbi:MAG: hypothetical protein N3I35_06130 [Clostridia bacterium]|nr:hypothetical protein [Clostridia bacterium]